MDESEKKGKVTFRWGKSNHKTQLEAALALFYHST